MACRLWGKGHIEFAVVGEGTGPVGGFTSLNSRYTRLFSEDRDSLVAQGGAAVALDRAGNIHEDEERSETYVEAVLAAYMRTMHMSFISRAMIGPWFCPAFCSFCVRKLEYVHLIDDLYDLLFVCEGFPAL